MVGGWSSNQTVSTASWDNRPTTYGGGSVYVYSTSYETSRGWMDVYSTSYETSRGWMDAWLDRYIRACRRRRWEGRLEALLSAPRKEPVGPPPARGLPKMLLWLTRVVRKGA